MVKRIPLILVSGFLSAFVAVSPAASQLPSVSTAGCDVSTASLSATLEQAASLMDNPAEDGDEQLAALQALRQVRMELVEYRADCVSMDSMLEAPNQVAGLPPTTLQQTPTYETIVDCPPGGLGGDPDLNRKKNRTDEPADGEYQEVEFSALINLPWPRAIARRDIDEWTTDQVRQIELAEGLPVSVRGYFAWAVESAPEATNCKLPHALDYHVWFIEGSAPGRSRSDLFRDRMDAIVVEPTPHLLATHDQWTVSRILDLACSGNEVRVSGWTMFDPEHPEQLGDTRGTLWEIHPVTRIEVNIGTTAEPVWEKLDTYDMSHSNFQEVSDRCEATS